MNKLVITRRASDYHVCIEGHPEIWGCGKTIPHAIGDFIMTHGDSVGIEIDYDRLAADLC